MTLMNTNILVENQRNQQNLRENSFCQSNGIISVKSVRSAKSACVIFFHADDADDADYLDENQRDNSVVV